MAIDLNDNIDHNFEKSSRAKDCQSDRSALQKQIDKQKADIDKMSKMVKKASLRVDELNTQLDNKVNNEELEVLRKLVMQLPKVQDVKELKEYIVENIENFVSDNEAFHREFKV